MSGVFVQRLLIVTLVVAISACGLPKTYRGDQIKPELPLGVGDKVSIRLKNADQAFQITITSLSTQRIEGRLVDDDSQTRGAAWENIAELREVGKSELDPKKFWIAVILSLIVIKQVSDGMDDIFGSFFGD